MGNPFKRRQAGAPTAPPAPAPDPNAQGPTTGPLPAIDGGGAAGLHRAESVHLVNYKPEELLQQVEGTLSRVHFGMSLNHRYKELVAELWSAFGPIVLFAGTAGEVFFFIWNNINAPGNKSPAWWVALSVLATVIVLECTFMVLSYKCDTLRNQLKGKPGGATVEDRREFASHRHFWFVLAAGVALGQISFLVVSMRGGLNNLAFLIVFAGGRSVATLAADYYTAFIHRAKPTTGEVAKMRLKERDDLAADLLAQSERRVSMLNTGILRLEEATVEAEIKRDDLHTALEAKKMQNAAQLEAMRQQSETARQTIALMNNLQRAIFDPTMPADQRAAAVNMLTAIVESQKELPPPSQGGRITSIREEDV